MDLYVVCKSMESYNRILIYFSENKIIITDSKLSFGKVNSEKIQYFNTEEKKIASFLTVELKNNFEHLKAIEEISQLSGVLYIEEL